jgi:hypothetical protein
VNPSRTPEGEPNRCPICGAQLQLEPSTPPGDAPCPQCGTLLWFDGGQYSPSPGTPSQPETSGASQVAYFQVERVTSAAPIGWDGASALGSTLAVNDRVAVSEGLFAGHEGVVTEIDRPTNRATVAIVIFGRSVPVEVPLTQLSAR